MKRAFAMAALLVLAACGAVRELRPSQGNGLPPAPYGADMEPTANRLLTPGAQARPLRTDDVLTSSQNRADDPYDLPPQS